MTFNLHYGIMVTTERVDQAPVKITAAHLYLHIHRRKAVQTSACTRVRGL